MGDSLAGCASTAHSHTAKELLQASTKELDTALPVAELFNSQDRGWR